MLSCLMIRDALELANSHWQDPESRRSMMMRQEHRMYHRVEGELPLSSLSDSIQSSIVDAHSFRTIGLGDTNTIGSHHSLVLGMIWPFSRSVVTISLVDVISFWLAASMRSASNRSSIASLDSVSNSTGAHVTLSGCWWQMHHCDVLSAVP